MGTHGGEIEHLRVGNMEINAKQDPKIVADSLNEFFVSSAGLMEAGVDSNRKEKNFKH